MMILLDDFYYIFMFFTYFYFITHIVDRRNNFLFEVFFENNFVLLTVNRYINPSIFDFEIFDKIFVECGLFCSIASITMSVAYILPALFS